MTEQWVLLWSHKQNALHIEPLSLMFTNNRNAYRDNRGGDYRLLLIGTREEVDATCDSMRSTMANREFDMPEKVVA
jgi:hypothetical protein